MSSKIVWSAACVLTLSLACAAPPAPEAGGSPGGEEVTEVTATPEEAPCHRVTTLAEGQVQIDCADGQAFVVRREPDGRWYEEMKVHAGVQRPAWASPEEAGRERCGCAAGE